MTTEAQAAPAAPAPAKQESVADLIRRLQVARERMSMRNDNRRLLYDCQRALVELTARVHHAESALTKIQQPQSTL